MFAYRIATLEQTVTTMAQGHDYQQLGYYNYGSYYQQANVAGTFSASDSYVVHLFFQFWYMLKFCLVIRCVVFCIACFTF